MPFRSRAQERWAFANPEKLGDPSAVREWAGATDFKNIPERSANPVAEHSEPRKMWLRGAVRHPNALTNAAKDHGVSKLQEAEKESHSSNPHVRSRGALGLRFIKHKI